MKINYDNINIPDENLNKVVSESLETVKKHHTRSRLRHIAGGCAAAVAAVAILTVISISNPVIAEKFTELGKIFGLVQDDQDYPGNYSDISVPVPDTNISTSNGITITLSEFVCSSESLNVSVLIESEEPFSPTFIEPDETADYDTNPCLSFVTEQSADFSGGALDLSENPYVVVQGDFQDEYTFAGVFRLDFNVYPYAQYEIPESFMWNLKVTEIRRQILAGTEIENPDLLSIPGEWDFTARITQQEIETKTVEVNEYAPNGSGISRVTITPYEVNVEDCYDESKIQPGYEEYDSMYTVILDGSGNLINDTVGLFPAAGHDLSEITVYYLDAPDNDEGWIVMQDRIHDKTFAPQLQEYLESTAVHKIEIPL